MSETKQKCPEDRGQSNEKQFTQLTGMNSVTEKYFDAKDDIQILNNEWTVREDDNEEMKPNISLLTRFSTWTGSTYKNDYTFKFAQYLLWVLSKVYASPGLRNLYSQISRSRYVMRFCGLPLAIDAVQTGYVSCMCLVEGLLIHIRGRRAHKYHFELFESD